MSGRQEALLIAGVAGTLMVLFPPWKHSNPRISDSYGYGFIATPPPDRYQKAAVIDSTRLVVQFLVVAIAAATAVAVIGNPKY